jgi:murein DD-endopeptidase MepM/ murein hydrolase activator NlpD
MITIFEKVPQVLLGIVLGGGLVILAVWWFVRPEDAVEISCQMDALLCPDGSSVGRSGPNCTFALCPSASPENKNVRVITLLPESVVASPLMVSGEARGMWYFEASFPVTVRDANDQVLGTGVAQAQGEWMTTEFVPFQTTVSFTPSSTPTGFVVFQKDNPSGLPEHADEVRVPVRFAGQSERPSMVPPLDRAGERVTKKPFGMLVDRATSPVQPERFSGYHTGTDFETFPDEATTDVLVRAICVGEVVVKRSASGYGGVLVTDCLIDGQDVTVVYGHLRLSSIGVQVGDEVAAGDQIGLLGTGGSDETDGERKHLHLGIHLGSTVNIQGYVATKSDLSGWIDPCRYICVDN